MILLSLKLVSSISSRDKTLWFFYLIFNYILRLIDGISRDLQKLPSFVNVTEIAAFFRIWFAVFGMVSGNLCTKSLALYLEDLKASRFLLLLSKLVASSLEQKYLGAVVSE